MIGRKTIEQVGRAATQRFEKHRRFGAIVLVSAGLLAAPASAPLLNEAFGTSTAIAQTLSAEALFIRYAEAETNGDFAEAAAAAERLFRGRHTGEKLPDEELRGLKEAAVENHFKAGNPVRAVVLLEEIIDEVEAETDGSSPELAALYERLADGLELIGDKFGAIEATNRALEIYGSLYGSKHPSFRFALARAAAFLNRVGENERAAELADRAVELEERAKAPDLFDRLSKSTRDITNQPYEVVDVYYGTNRKPSGKGGLDGRYGGERGPLSLGIVSVSVPRENRSFGELNEPRLFRLEFRPDPAKHIMLFDVQPLGAPIFYERLRGDINRSARREALVYIHGFKNTFDDAAKRTAQLAYDLDIDGAPILYSWPSGGNLLSYVADGNEADSNRQALRDFEEFLTRIVDTSGAESIHVIAHSMGNRILTQALTNIIEDRQRRGEPPRPLFDQVVFAAPDLDRTVLEELVPLAKDWANGLTLYASSSDRALEISQRLNGTPRAGDANPPLVLAGLDTIDATSAPADALGHTYFASGALGDVQAVVWHGFAPNLRCVLRPEGVVQQIRWRFDRNQCDDRAFRLAMFNLRRFGLSDAKGQAESELAEAQEARNRKDIALWEEVLTQYSTFERTSLDASPQPVTPQ